MDPLTILGSVAGIGQTLGSGIASLVKKKRAKQDQPPPSPQVQDEAPQPGGPNQVAGGVNPVAQPAVNAPTQPQQAQAAAVPQALSQSPTPASPLQNQKNEFLMKMLFRNGTFDDT